MDCFLIFLYKIIKHKKKNYFFGWPAALAGSVSFKIRLSYWPKVNQLTC